MIKNISIKKFGLFNNYVWDNHVGRDISFSKLNILYGRNYSGKTTLARIFRCIEKEELHKNYLDAEFSITCYDGSLINNTNCLQSLKSSIRVYNSDFVRENLSWLHNEDGTIQPFTILGSKNVELDNKIKAIEEVLGNLEEKKGLLFDFTEKNNLYDKKNRELTAKKNELENKLKAKANDEIKVNSNYFIPTNKKKTYQINDIKNDIEVVKNTQPKYILNQSEINALKQTLSEKQKIDINRLTESKPQFEKFYNNSSTLLSKKILPSQPIAELLNDHLLQNWVRDGIDKHKGKRTTCGFCGSMLPQDLWQKLDQHFNKESEDLRTDIKRQINVLEHAKKSLSEFITLKKEDFYSDFQIQFIEWLIKWNLELLKYVENIEVLMNELKARENDIFSPNQLPSINDASDNILALFKELNLVIDKTI